MSYEEISCRRVKGRKTYSCSWCGDRIDVSEEHFSRAYIFEGNFNSDRMHIECFKAMEDSCHDISEGWISGEMQRGVPLRGGVNSERDHRIR